MNCKLASLRRYYPVQVIRVNLHFSALTAPLASALLNYSIIIPSVKQNVKNMNFSQKVDSTRRCEL